VGAFQVGGERARARAREKEKKKKEEEEEEAVSLFQRCRIGNSVDLP